MKESRIDTSNTQGKDKNVLNNWLSKRIATTTNPAVWLFWPTEKTDVYGPVRRVSENWVPDDEYLKSVPKDVFDFMKKSVFFDSLIFIFVVFCCYIVFFDCAHILDRTRMLQT